MKNVHSYRPGHPNPQFYRGAWLSLNGAWDFSFCDEGELPVDQIPEKTLTIQVPYAYESEKSGIADKSEHHQLAYWRHFENPHLGERTLLHLERSDYYTEVFLNGAFVGSHKGGYEAFCFDITPFLNEGDNLLALRIYDDKNAAHLRGKQTWRDSPFECFYLDTSGVYSDVWLEGVASNYIQGFDIRGSSFEKTAYFRLAVSPNAVPSFLKIEVAFAGKTVVSKELPVKNLYQEFSLAIPAKDFQAWSVDKPSLYDLTLTLTDAEGKTDRVLSYFGFNQVSAQKGLVYLNGKKTTLKLVLNQGYYVGGDLTGTEEEMLSDIKATKAMGFNGWRIHQKVETQLFHYLCDREGIVSWLELPSAHHFDSAEQEQAAQEWSSIVASYVSHPSIIAYVPFNESWGIEEVKTSREEQAFVKRMYDLTNSVDWSRPVISNDGWEHVESDFLTCHDYRDGAGVEKAYQSLKPTLEAQKNFALNEARNIYVEGPIHYDEQPLLMSEFAGITYVKKGDEGYGYNNNVHSTSDFLAKYQALLNAIKKDGFVGYCATQLCDVYQEKNGFLTHNREKKMAFSSLKKANDSF